jgi:X-X-X-Leu-X-X-Gly heptad repeat protein
LRGRAKQAAIDSINAAAGEVIKQTRKVASGIGQAATGVGQAATGVGQAAASTASAVGKAARSGGTKAFGRAVKKFGGAHGGYKSAAGTIGAKVGQLTGAAAGWLSTFGISPAMVVGAGLGGAAALAAGLYVKSKFSRGEELKKLLKSVPRASEIPVPPEGDVVLNPDPADDVVADPQDTQDTGKDIYVFKNLPDGGKGVQSQLAKSGVKGKDMSRMMKGLRKDLTAAGFNVLEEAKRRTISLTNTLAAFEQITDPNQKEVARKVLIALLRKHKIRVDAESSKAFMPAQAGTDTAGTSPETDDLKKGDAVEYASGKGKKSAVVVDNPNPNPNKPNLAAVHKINPKNCADVPNSEFAASKKNMGDEIKQCDIDTADVSDDLEDDEREAGPTLVPGEKGPGKPTDISKIKKSLKPVKESKSKMGAEALKEGIVRRREKSIFSKWNKIAGIS